MPPRTGSLRNLAIHALLAAAAPAVVASAWWLRLGDMHEGPSVSSEEHIRTCTACRHPNRFAGRGPYIRRAPRALTDLGAPATPWNTLHVAVPPGPDSPRPARLVPAEKASAR